MLENLIVHNFVHPHRQQFNNDVVLLRYFDNFSNHVDAVLNDPIILFSDLDVKRLFLEIDLSVLKATVLTSAVPPPDVLNIPAVITLPNENQNKFVCFDRVADGSVCGREFETYKQLITQRVRSTALGGDHGILTLGALVVTTACFFCGEVFGHKSCCTGARTECLHEWLLCQGYGATEIRVGVADLSHRVQG
jgi:hypothetical protein